MYNTTPHRVTRVTPHFLMFGRGPQLPIDQLLSRSQTSWSEDYVKDQSELMEKAYQMVIDRQKAAAEKEEQRHKVREVPLLQIGDRVLLRREAFSGRHKLEDKFESSPYLITAHNEGNDVWQIRPVLGGRTNWVNRRRLIVDPRQMGESIDILPIPSDPNGNSDKEMELSPDADGRSDDDSNDSDDDVPIWLYVTSSETGSQNAKQLRRSTRSTRGKNPNPFRLPTSAITGLPV